MQFLFQPLTWGFLLILLPLLIHLINMMRQRRVKWAAMEFLLQAHKKLRRWIWLKQFLLLASRMLLMAVAVAMLAHLVTRDQWTSFFGGKTTHHIVLLDDSYSMSDIMGAKSSYDRASEVLTRLANRAKAQDSLQKFTLLRFSRATATGSTSANDAESAAPSIPDDQIAGAFGQFADLNAVPVDVDFDVLLEERRRTFGVSQLAAGPNEALQLTAQLVAQADDERPFVYIVSDFRQAQWQSPTESIATITRLEKAGADVNLVQCAETEHPNLAIVDVRPAEGTRAAGVPLFVDVTITNYGAQEVLQVPVDIQSTYYGKDDSLDDPTKSVGVVSDLPKLLIDRIAPGETLTRSVQVYFATAGQHVVSATLPADSVLTDNSRWCVVDFTDGIQVLVIDGDSQLINAAYLQSVFQPGERVQTGIRPNVQPITFLRDTQPDALAEFHVIYLLDVPRLDALARQNLTEYVNNGGGLAIFLGPNSQLKSYAEWYADGQGLFPIPVERFDMLPTSNDGAPDLIVDDHPIFRVLLGEGQVFASAIRINQHASGDSDWAPRDDSTTRVIASLRNGEPIAVERTQGNGRVVAMLTTLAPTWNTWATQPTFPVMLLQMQSYLDAGRQPVPSRLVGAPLNVQLETARFQPQVIFMVPGQAAGRRLPVTRQAVPTSGDKSPIMQTGLGSDAEQSSSRTDRSGIYEAWPRTLDGELRVQRFALNVDPREGDLAIATSQDLAESLAGTQVELFRADELALGDSTDGGFSWSQFLMIALLVLLVAEQLLAYSASYLPPAGAT